MPPSPPPDATPGDGRPSPTVSVVIPALNEESCLPLVLEGLPDVDEVIIVDGGSADDTVRVALEVRPDAVVVRQTRSGKGNALACGFAVATGDIVITLNGDGSTDPGEIPRYVDALLAGAEVAHGSRYRIGGGNLDERRLDRIGNRTLNQIVNALFGTRFTDLGYGYNAYWRKLLPALDLPEPRVPGLRRGSRLWGDGPEIEPLVNIRMAAQGLRVVEVASVGYPRIYGTRERHPAQESVRALRTTLNEYLRRWKITRHTPDQFGHGAQRGVTTSGTTTGVGRGTRRHGAPSGGQHVGARTGEESYVPFLPPANPTADPFGEDRSTGRHAAHRAEPDPVESGAAGTGGRRHRHLDNEPRRESGGGWTHAPNPRQQPPWSLQADVPPIDQRTWRDSYTDPDSVVPGDSRQYGDRRGPTQRRGRSERRQAGQRWQTTDNAGPAATWHLPAPYQPARHRPDLTVIAGEGWQEPGDGRRSVGSGPRPAHLRAVPGEQQYGRPGHRA
jgi:hypothetical protein